MWRQWVSWNQTFKHLYLFFQVGKTKITKNTSPTKLNGWLLLSIFCWEFFHSGYQVAGVCWVGLATTGRWSCWDHKLRRMQWHGPSSLHPMLSPGVHFSEWDKVSDGKNRMTMEDGLVEPPPKKRNQKFPWFILKDTMIILTRPGGGLTHFWNFSPRMFGENDPIWWAS